LTGASTMPRSNRSGSNAAMTHHGERSAIHQTSEPEWP
jgi:hypothetical protein